jgi:small conductance mechanosensitive channel
MMHSVEYDVAYSIVSVVIIVGVLEFLSLVLRRAARAAGASRGVQRDVSYAARIIEVAISAFTVLQIAGYGSVFTTYIVSGITAVAVSLALQNTLSNIISGLLLLSDGVIHVGDVIEYSGTKGEIVRIALRNTWVKQADGSIAVVSNTSLSNGPLINRTSVDRLKKRYAFE